MMIYIAGKWEEHSIIAEYATKLEAKGHTITLPWYLIHLGNTPLAQAAEEDVLGVYRAETCIFIFERPLPYKGAFAELGMAIALKKRIILVGNGGDSCVFTHLQHLIRVNTFEQAMEVLDGR